MYVNQVREYSFFGSLSEKIWGRKDSEASTRASASSDSIDQILHPDSFSSSSNSSIGFENVVKESGTASESSGVKKTLKKTRSFGFRPRSLRTRNSFQQDLQFESGREWKENREERDEKKRLEEEAERQALEHLDAVRALRRSNTPTTPSRSPVFRKSFTRSDTVLSSGVPTSPSSPASLPRFPSLKFTPKPYSVPCRKRDEPISDPETLASSEDESEKPPLLSSLRLTSAKMD